MPHTLAVGAGRLDVVSMGLLVEDEESALLWRGLMLNRAVQHFLEDVTWAEDLDYIVIDMPPGTGDVAMGLARMLPRAELLVVTTPATGAQKVAARAVTMARKSYLRVAGVIENMSAFVAPDGTSYPLFGEGGGACARSHVWRAPRRLDPARGSRVDRGRRGQSRGPRRGPGGRSVPVDRGPYRHRDRPAGGDGRVHGPDARLVAEALDAHDAASEAPESPPRGLADRAARLAYSPSVNSDLLLGSLAYRLGSYGLGVGSRCRRSIVIVSATNRDDGTRTRWPSIVSSSTAVGCTATTVPRIVSI